MSLSERTGIKPKVRKNKTFIRIGVYEIIGWSATGIFLITLWIAYVVGVMAGVLIGDVGSYIGLFFVILTIAILVIAGIGQGVSLLAGRIKVKK